VKRARARVLRPALAPQGRRAAALFHLSAAALGVVVALGGCSSVSDTLAPAKVDYRAGAVKTSTLEVPPDLTQLTADPRFQPPVGGSVSATALQSNPVSPVAGATTTAVVAPVALGATRIERSGNLRWLVSPQTPEQLWPLLRAFWQNNGFTLTIDQPQIGVLETDWAENRARLPEGGTVQRLIGKALDSLRDSGERDLYRTRIERAAGGGTEIYISHRGAVEEYTDASRERTRWMPRANDPQLEAEMLSRLLQQLSSPDASTVTAANPAQPPAAALAEPAVTTPPRARELTSGQPGAALQVDDTLERAWRRVGVALDRSGFTVEDRDRSLGVYYVRYVDPKLAGQEEPGFFARTFTGAKKANLTGERYQIALRGQGATSVVSVLDSQGAAQNSDSARNIIQLLVKELR
jgi:outer membrane protein assembly factor BamC